MSRRDRTYYWRHVRCDGCERECRYRDFRPDPPVPSYAEIHQIMIDNPKYPFHRRGTVLGFMHEWKLRFWDKHCDDCREAGRVPEPVVQDGQVLVTCGRGPGPDDCPF